MKYHIICPIFFEAFWIKTSKNLAYLYNLKKDLKSKMKLI